MTQGFNKLVDYATKALDKVNRANILPKASNALFWGSALAPEVINFTRGLGDFNKPLQSTDGLRMPVLAKTVAKFVAGDNSNIQPSNKDVSSNISSTTTGNSNMGSIGTVASNKVNARAIAQQLANELPQQEAQTNNTQSSPQAVIDYINQLQNINQPYIDALQNYSNNYDDLARRNFNAQRYFTAMAGLSGNQGYTRLGDAINPINNEVNKLNTLKLLRDAQAGDVNAINEVMGNLAVAKEMDITPEAAFANKNLLTALMQNKRILTDWDKAQLLADVKRYGYDSAFSRAIQQQQLRNLGNLAVANTYMGGGYPGVAPGLNARGVANNQDIGLEQILKNAQNQNNR